MSDSSDQIELVKAAANSHNMPLPFPPPQLPLDTTEKEEDQQATTKKIQMSTQEQNFWQNIVEQIYTSENHVIKIELLNSIFIYVNICKDSFFEHNEEYEPFFSSLMSICAHNVLKYLDSYSIEQVIELELACHHMIRYFLGYLRNKHKQNMNSSPIDHEDEESILSSNQVLTILDSLLNSRPIDISYNEENQSTIDLSTLVAVLISAKIPHTTTTPKATQPLINPKAETTKPIDDSKSGSDSNTRMKDLINSFLNNKFTRSVDNEKKSTPPPPPLAETNKELESSNRLKEIYLNKSPQELFSYFTRKYFTLHKGIRVILDECENHLTYLNVYRKNNLKQLFTQNSLLHMTSQTAAATAGSAEVSESQSNTMNSNQITPNKSLSFGIIEEALQAKANCLNLTKDLDFFARCILLPVFNEKHLMLDETFCDENTKETFNNQLDKKFVEQITHLTMAIQIATIITCSSDLVLQQQHLLTQEPNSISKTNNANPSNNNNSLQTQTSISSKNTRSSSDSQTMSQNESSFLFLTKKTIKILDNYFNIIELNFPANLQKNANAQMSFVIAYFLNKVLQHQSLIKLNNKKFSASDQSNTIATETLANLPILSNELNLFIGKLISMFQKVFIDETDSSSMCDSSPLLAIKDFDIFAQYKHQDLFSLFNFTHTNHSNNQFRLFSFMITLMRICFVKCHQINSSIVGHKLTNFTVNESQELDKDNNTQLSSSFDKIKNIDDPNSDDEQHLQAIVAPAAASTATSKELKTEEDWDDYYMISNLFDEQTIPHFQQQKSVSLPLISQSSLTSNTVKTETEKQDAEELTLDLNIQATNVELLNEIINFLIRLVSSTHFVQSTLKETLTDCLNQPEQIKEFVYMINETETKMEKTFVQSFAILFYRFIECLIVRKLIDCSKQDLLLDGLNTTNSNEKMLFVNKNYLAITCQIMTLRLNDESLVEKTREKIVNEWKSFLQLIESKTVDKKDNDDVNVEHMALKLYLFHCLTDKQRKLILNETSNCLIRLVQTMPAVHAHDQSIQPINLITRLLVIFNYLLRHFDQPSTILIEIFEKIFLNAFNQITPSSHQFFLIDALEQAKKLNSNIHEAKVESDLSFYSLTSTSIDKLLSEPTLSHPLLVNIAESDDVYEQLYLTMLNLISLPNKCDYRLVVVYNFVHSWSLLEPAAVNAYLPANQELIQMLCQKVFSQPETGDLNENLASADYSLENNNQIAQLFRLAFRRASNKHQLSLISNAEQPEVSFEFFIKFWTHKLNKILCASNFSKEPAVNESNYKILCANLDLLNYHLNLLNYSHLNDSVGTVLNSLKLTTLCDLIQLVVKLINACRFYFKRFVLLGKYFDANNDSSQIETILMQLLNINSIRSTVNRPNSILASNDKVNYSLEQINTAELNSSCLINLFDSDLITCFKNLNTYLTDLDSNQTQMHTVTDSEENSANAADRELCLSLMNGASFEYMLKNLTSFLNTLFGSFEKRADFAKSQSRFEDLFRLIENTFISINGDLNCFRYLCKSVLVFFNSSYAVQCNLQQTRSNDLDLYFNLSKTKYEYCLLAKLSSFTFQVIYQLCTDYYLNNSSTNDKSLDLLFQDLLKYVEKSLDWPNGIQGFCDFFTSSNQVTLFSAAATTAESLKTSLIANTTNKFLIFLSTSSSTHSSQEYFVQMLKILNKLFKISHSFSQQLKQPIETAGSANLNQENSSQETLLTKLNKVLSQINQIADLDTDFLQKWLSKLVLPASSSILNDEIVTDQTQQSNTVTTSKYVLKQVALFLINDKMTNIVGEVVTLSVLNALIQLASKLINTHNGYGFADLISLMDTLSGAGQGLGHLYLFQASCIWLEYLSTIKLDKSIKPQSFDKIQTENSQNSLIQSGCYILSYVCEILHILKQSCVKTTSNSAAANSLASIDTTVLDDFDRFFQHNFLTDLSSDTAKMFEFIQANEDSFKEYASQPMPNTSNTTTATRSTSAESNQLKKNSTGSNTNSTSSSKKRSNLKRAAAKSARRLSSGQVNERTKMTGDDSNSNENGADDDEEDDDRENYLAANAEPNNSYLDEYSENENEKENFETDEDENEDYNNNNEENEEDDENVYDENNQYEDNQDEDEDEEDEDEDDVDEDEDDDDDDDDENDDDDNDDDEDHSYQFVKKVNKSTKPDSSQQASDNKASGTSKSNTATAAAASAKSTGNAENRIDFDYYEEDEELEEKNSASNRASSNKISTRNTSASNTKSHQSQLANSKNSIKSNLVNVDDLYEEADYVGDEEDEEEDEEDDDDEDEDDDEYDDDDPAVTAVDEAVNKSKQKDTKNKQTLNTAEGSTNSSKPFGVNSYAAAVQSNPSKKNQPEHEYFEEEDEIEEENTSNNTNTNTTSNNNNNNNNNVESGSKNNAGLRVRAQQLHEDEEDMEEDDEDEEYGEDFNDNFVVDYENVDRRTLIKELVNASNALGSANDQMSSSNNDASKKSSSLSATGNANLGNDSDLAASNLNDSGRDAIYKDLMSTISAAAAAISGRLQNQLSTGSNPPSSQSNSTKYSNDPNSSKVNKDVKSQSNSTGSVKPKVNSNNPVSSNPVESSNEHEDHELNSKLCTFTVTKKEFMNQHWYYCHTCKMIDRIGMCTICAKVCHKDHDVSYAKYGSFFCDCGAKEDGSCLALTKRSSSGNNSNNNKPNEPKVPHKSSLRPSSKKSKDSSASVHSAVTALPADSAQTQTQIQTNNSNAKTDSREMKNTSLSTVELLKKIQLQFKLNKPKQLERQRTQLIECIRSKDLLKTIRYLLENTLLPLAKKFYDESLINTNSLLARKLLSQLKGTEFKLVNSSWSFLDSKESQEANKDTAVAELTSVQNQKIEFKNACIEQQQLFVVTLGSQEGAFENVRLTYASDHGPMIKQLIQTHSLRRTSMCCLATKSKKHLIVTHEKGKSSHFTVLQLNALLKQDSNKKNKLTLTKLNTVPVPFTLLSVVANYCNEDYIALNGLKDCYVMYLSENGQTKQELLIQQQNSASTNSTSVSATNTASGTNASATGANQPATTENSTQNSSLSSAGKFHKQTTSPSSQLPSLSSNSAGLIVLHPSLESSNYIIKSLWLPGSQTELALITSEFIKIYDLSIDKISPVFYYLLPIGKIKDVTFVYDTHSDLEACSSSPLNNEHLPADAVFKQSKYIVIMSSCGYMYYEEMNDVTSAKNGVYYITNTIEFQYEPPPASGATQTAAGANTSSSSTSSTFLSPKSSETAVTSNNLFGGGISVYYSFKLGLLFWSYQQGKTFIGSFKSHSLALDKVLPLNLNGNQTNKSSSSSVASANTSVLSSFQALCNWSEIPTHPGLVMAMTLLSNNPVVLMLLPDKIYIQEIKLVNNQGGPSKAKIQDMVATRHLSVSSTPPKSTPGESSANSLSIDSLRQNNDDDTSNDIQSQQQQSHSSHEDELRSGVPLLSNEKTTMIILCDDGSLKIYVADSEKTEYWLQPHLKSTSPLIQLKSAPIWSASSLFHLSPMSIFKNVNSKKFESESLQSLNDKQLQSQQQQLQHQHHHQQQQIQPKPAKIKAPKHTTDSSSSSRPNSNVDMKLKIGSAYTFPIDYFEKCSQLNDVEYGGNDLLEVYNSQQLKSRLSNGGNKFVASTKATGFKLEITNKNDADRSLLMGCRILCGTHSLDRVPLSIQVFDRRIPIKCSRQRWYDVCLTREEAMIADNKLTVLIGSSADQRHITVIDACVPFVKTKESLNWSKSEAQQLVKRYLLQKNKLGSAGSSVVGFDDYFGQQLLGNIKSKGSNETSTVNSSKKLISSMSCSKKNTNQMNAHKSSLTSLSSKTWFVLDYKLSAFDQLLGQSLDVLENCILLLNNSNEDQQQLTQSNTSKVGSLVAYSYQNISIDLLSLICPPLITFKAKSLLLNVLQLPSMSSYSASSLINPASSAPPTSIATLYNNYVDDALLNLLAKTFDIRSISALMSNITASKDYLNFVYDLETLEKTLLICKSLIQQQRANNMVKYLNDKFNIASNGQKHFLTALSSLFWSVVNRTHLQSNKNRLLNTIGTPEIKNLHLLIENLIEIMTSYLMVELTSAETAGTRDEFFNSKILSIVVDCLMRLLCSNELEINFTSRKVLLHLLKPSKKASASSGSSGSSITTILPTSQTTSTSVSKVGVNSTVKTKQNTPSLPPPPPPPPPTQQQGLFGQESTADLSLHEFSHQEAVSSSSMTHQTDEAVHFPIINLTNSNNAFRNELIELGGLGEGVMASELNLDDINPAGQNVNPDALEDDANQLERVGPIGTDLDDENEEDEEDTVASAAAAIAAAIVNGSNAGSNANLENAAAAVAVLNQQQQNQNDLNNLNDFQFFALPPYVFNEDDEMLQLAMALSLNEQQQQQPSVTASPAIVQPPAPMPRSSTNLISSQQSTTETNTPFNSLAPNLAKRSSLKVKSKSASTKEEEAAAATASDHEQASIKLQSSTTCVTQLNVPAQSISSYLVNTTSKLYQLRKILLEKFSQNIDINVLQAYFRMSTASSAVNNGGIKAIAFFQLILTLMTDLNAKEERDKQILDVLIQQLLNILKPLKNLSNKLNDLNDAQSLANASSSLAEQTEAQQGSSSSTTSQIYARNQDHELQLLALRTISILLSKSKYQRSGDNCNFIIQTLLNHLCHFDIVEVCLNLMKLIYFDYWKKMPVQAVNDSLLIESIASSTNATVANAGESQQATQQQIYAASIFSASGSTDRFNSSGLMKFQNESSYYEELAPYFVRDPLNKDSFVIPVPILINLNNNSETSAVSSQQQQSKTTPVSIVSATANSTSLNLFDNYAELLTEILIRLPYQMKKLCLGSSSSSSSTANPNNINLDQATLQYQMNLGQIAQMFEFSAWTHYLCEYLLLPQCAYLKRLIKKLLQILCGSKDKYRKFKDQHILTTCIRQLVSLCPLASSPQPFSMLGMGSTISQASESLMLVNELNQNLIFFKPAMHSGSGQHQIKLTYLSLLKIIDNLKVILEVAVARTLNWQRFCTQNPSTILYFIDLALLMGVDSNGSGCDSSSLSGCGSVAAASTPVIIPTILQLLLCSLGATKSSSKASQQTASNMASSLSSAMKTSSVAQSVTNITNLTQQSKQSSKKSTSSSSRSLTIADENLCSCLVNSLFRTVSKDTMYKFIRTYLLEASQVSIRWTLHSLLYSVFKNSNSANQEQLYDILIQLWPDAMTAYGGKAAQYVDLIGYIVIKLSSASQTNGTEAYTSNNRLKEFLHKIIEIFQNQNLLLATHPNSNVYNTLETLLNDFEGLYLESDPCFICNNIETPIVSFKLNTIKADSRFTTNQQIFKLTGSHSISKVLVKISEIRKSKMVSAINVYYTNKSAQSIVDLKMNSKLWLKAKRVNIQPAQQEVKIEFQLPIIACNLMIEYADFYERDAQTHTETTILQCPRCSASVPAHPGVCNTCGENVFQCHKCRSINYDERDPFLCNSCGFCKFAKFDFTLVGRQCCAVDPIESEEDRKQTLQTISSLLERADKIYNTLSQQTKPTLEALIVKLNEQNVIEKFLVAPQLQPSAPFSSSSAQPQQQQIINGSGDLQQINLITNPSSASSNPGGIIGIKVTTLNNNNNNSNNVSATQTSGNVASHTNHYNSKTIQSIVQKYSVECKNKFDDLSKIILKLNLCRKELREYDRQFKTFNWNSSQTNVSSTSTSSTITRKNSIAFDTSAQQQQQQQQQSSTGLMMSTASLIWNQNFRNKCYGCASASIEHCINLFRALICSNSGIVFVSGQQPSPFSSSSMTTTSKQHTLNNSMVNYIKSELCRNGLLEELINFNLKRSLLFYNSSNSTAVLSTSSSNANSASSSTTTAPTAAPTTTSTSTTTAPTATSTSTTASNNSTATPSTNASADSKSSGANTSSSQRMYHRDIINLIYLLIKDNVDGTERFQKIITEKIEAFLTPIPSVLGSGMLEDTYGTSSSCLSVSSSLYQISGANATNSPLKHEMMLLTSLMQKPHDESCWEMRIRLVIHILLRSLSVASVTASSTTHANASVTSLHRKRQQQLTSVSNPVIVECLTLPCLRILNHVCKTTTNISLLSSLALQSSGSGNTSTTGIKTNLTSTAGNKLNMMNSNQTPLIRPSLFTPSSSSNSAASANLSRYYSEPADISYSQQQQHAQSNLVNPSLSLAPQTGGPLTELDPNEFLSQPNKNATSLFYEKWLQANNRPGSASSSSSSSKTINKLTDDFAMPASVSPQLLQIKSKYFAAWRKYTLKKRKQQLQQHQINSQASNTNSFFNTINTSSSATSSESISTVSSTTTSGTNTIKTPLRELNHYEYDLKFKWLKLCLFCPSSKSVRQLTCNLLQNIFNFYTSTSFMNNPLNASGVSGSVANNVTDLLPNANSLKKFQIAELLNQYLDEAGATGECFSEYLQLLKHVINDRECKYRLVLHCGILNQIEVLLHKEIKYLSDLERLSELSSRSDRFSLLVSSPYGLNLSYMSTATNLAHGYSIKCLTDLLATFLKENNIKNKFKGRLIATVLNSYLSLKKLVYQRTKLVEEAQEKLLNTLEQMTSGTEAETRKFMSICIDTVNNFDLDDLVTPVFIFERLCNIIYPEEIVDNKEFLLILEKDPNQEDYLQGRMLGNPYSSNEPGLGPLMRNVKNKICTDCELIALLEDDNGMELLVNNKIISLDLSVREVYKKVWLAEVLSEHEPMRIVYRMTGLSGDATEDIIDNLDGKGNDLTKNDEEIYRMADELAKNSNALNVMLERLASITQQNFTFGKPLLSVLLKLFDYALKLSINRQSLIQPEMKTITTMLQTLNMMLKIEQTEPNKIGVHLAEQLLNIMECILSEASKQPADVYNEFSSLCGDTEQLEFLLNNIKCTFVRSHPKLLQGLMKLIPFLSFGDEKKMQSLISYFSTYYSNFDSFDLLIHLNIHQNQQSIMASNNSTTGQGNAGTGGAGPAAGNNNAGSSQSQLNTHSEQTSQINEEVLHLECFCVIVNGIEIGEMGKRLRDMMRDGGVSSKAIEYLLRNSPKVTTYLNSDYDLWKEFISRNSLPYVLRILTGLCRSHESIQDLIGESCIPLLHKLEQFSASNLVGILAEDLLVALRQNQSSKVAAAIEEVRNQTRNEKKKLAMAKRQKQLNQLGMKANDKGQLVATDPSTLKNITDEVEEEKGHICCICREGYKYHPQKVLAIYTFSKKVDLEPIYEAKARKTIGYSTVTHFNLVHIDCHTNAIRSARTCRDEWENAALQNANTKCNGILPIWGPDVTETVFSNALARHNNYLLEATGIRETTYTLSVHDLKLLMIRFSENLSFSEDSGGGGRESNINLIPYMIHSILYSINTAKYVTREERNLNNFLESSEKLVQNSFECDNVFYFISMALVIMKPTDWKSNRVKFLQRILFTAHSRLVNTPSSDKQKLNSVIIQEFKKYKPALLFIGLVDLFYKHLNSKILADENNETTTLNVVQAWTEKFGNYIRHNDIAIMDICRKVLKDFEEELLVCEDWLEMFDVMGFLEDVNDPLEFLKTCLQNFAK